MKLYVKNNSQILFNLRKISSEIDKKNMIWQAQIRKAYTNLSNNTKRVLSDTRSRNSPYPRTMQGNYTC